MSDKLVLIDLSGIAHPIFHMTDGDSNPNAVSTAIVERIRAMASAHQHVAICCDSGRSFRKDIDPTYKANRQDSDKDAERARIRHQIDLATEILRGDGFPVWSAKGFEADDLIASAVLSAETSTFVSANGATVEILPRDVLIISPDKDLRQLVSERVSVLAPANGDRPEKLYDAEAVYLKHGVTPNQLTDYLALVGDASDNIRGAKGIGEKTAAKLITQYGNLDDLYAAIEAGTTDIKPAGLASLTEFRERMETVRSLIRLRTDVPLPFEEIFRERVPQDGIYISAPNNLVDVVVFGEDEMKDDIEPLDDIDFALMSSEGKGPVAGFPQGIIDVEPQKAQEPEMRRVAYTKDEYVPVDSKNEIVKVHAAPAEWERGLEPRSMDEAVKLADRLMASRLFSAYGHPAGILATVLAGRELGIQAMASLRAFHIIEGKPTLSAGAIVALIMKSGKAEYFRPVERTAEKATFVTKRHGDPEVTMTFTIDEAKQAWSKDAAAFGKSAWGKHPADMCVARCSSKLARLVYPDVVFNLYAPEEFD
jgi:5'-3' exonuclease